MSTFNHRTLRKQDSEGDFYFEVHEVYYDEEGKIDGWTVSPKAAFGYSKEELKENLEMMLKSLEAPILTEIEGGLIEVAEDETK